MSPTALMKCTAVLPSGDPCDQPSAPSTPFPICARHAVEAYRYVSKQVGNLSDDPAWMAKFQEESRTAKLMREKRRGITKVDQVYYARLGEHIIAKIGYSSCLSERLKSYGPTVELLAVELGDRAVERHRHEQFREHLAVGTEWFHAHPDLLSHIARLTSERSSL